MAFLYPYEIFGSFGVWTGSLAHHHQGYCSSAIFPPLLVVGSRGGEFLDACNLVSCKPVSGREWGDGFGRVWVCVQRGASR